MPNAGDYLGKAIEYAIKFIDSKPEYVGYKVELDFNGTRREVYKGIDVELLTKNWYVTNYNVIQESRNSKIEKILNK